MQQRPFALPDHRIVALSGRDALAFAQAQFMSDAAALAAGHWQWSGWLMPKGRVIALFALLKFSDQALWLLLPDADPDEFTEQLRRFVFRSKVAIAVRDELHAGGAFKSPEPDACGSRMAVTGDDDTPGTVMLDMGAGGGARALRIAANDIDEDADALARWIAFDLEHGLPRLPASQAGQWTPQQLSLSRLHAYSVKKGCYPGQEIVARTHFLGQAKRGLALFASEAAPAPGAQIVDGERTLGTIISTAAAGEHCLALAVTALDHASAGLRAEDIPLRPLPLLDGLARPA